MSDDLTKNEIITLIFSGIVMISTVWNSILTRLMVKESRKLREFQITPDVVVFYDFNETDPSHLYLVIENKGLGVAKGLAFNVIKNFSFEQPQSYVLTNRYILKKGLHNFYSGQKFRLYLTDLSQKSEDKINDKLIIELVYYDINGKIYKPNFTLEICETLDGGRLTPPETYVGKIAHQLDEIRKLLKKHWNINF